MQGQDSKSQIGDVMRFWRHHRGKSQLDISMEMRVSQRHVSFVESGKSHPSRNFLVSFSEALTIPFRERNALLLAAGYAPLYRESSLEDADMDAINRAIDGILRHHEPHPAFLLDRYWNVLRANEAAPKFLSEFIRLDVVPKPRNLLELMFDPEGLRPFIENWTDFAASLLQRIRREALGQIYDERLAGLVEKLGRYPGVNTLTPADPGNGSFAPVVFRKGGKRVSYFSLITTVGTPQSVTAEELRVDCLFPAE